MNQHPVMWVQYTRYLYLLALVLHHIVLVKHNYTSLRKEKRMHFENNYPFNSSGL